MSEKSLLTDDSCLHTRSKVNDSCDKTLQYFPRHMMLSSFVLPFVFKGVHVLLWYVLCFAYTGVQHVVHIT